MAIPEEIFKRRKEHNNTPQSFFLITVNYVVVCLAVSFFAKCDHTHWAFWACLGLLAVYNVFNIRRNREEYNKIQIIAYLISLAGLVLLAILLKVKNC